MALMWPLVQQGSKGEDVRTVQYLVTAQGHPTAVDGVFGSSTKTAVEAFQASRGLSADGVVGAQTWPQLIIQVQQGSNGDAVRAVQSQMHSRGGGAAIVIDGVFGSLTHDAVRAFQALLGLSVDGIVGPQTWNYLVNDYLAAPDHRGIIWSTTISPRQIRTLPPRTCSAPGRHTIAIRPPRTLPQRR